MFWLILILLILLIYFVFVVAQFINVVFKNYAPYVATGREAIRQIITEVRSAGRLKDEAVVYELGCGRARFLRQAERVWPGAKLIGVENLLILYLLDRLLFKLQGSKIKILKKDFFALDLADAGLIYCYLNNTTMMRLSEKLKRECRSGTQIVSRGFSIPGWTPEKVLEIKNKKVYFYSIK